MEVNTKMVTESAIKQIEITYIDGTIDVITFNKDGTVKKERFY